MYTHFLVTGVFTCKLKFIVKDCDPTSGVPDDEAGYEDEYTVCLRFVYFYSTRMAVPNNDNRVVP